MDTDKTDKTAGLASTISKIMAMEKAADGSNYMEVPIGFVMASRYIIESKISEGGMGVVYSAFDTKLRQTRAIKLLKRDISKSKDIVTKLIQEAKVAMMLTHPRIMRLINFEQDGPYAFLLMEYVEGRNLRILADLQPDKKLDEKLVGRIGYMICDALEYAHNKNVIHRDIKPANIIINDELDSVKLMDFGIAKVLAQASEEQPQIAGTLFYIAPEVFGGAAPSAAVDIYALGLSLYELLAGSHPFGDPDPQKVIDHHFKTKPPALEGVDRRLLNIIFQCIEKRPNARFQDASELKKAFLQNLDLGEETKFYQMQQKVERDKKIVDHKLKRIELEEEKLASQREEMEKEQTAAPPVQVFSHTGDPDNAPSEGFASASIPVLATLIGVVAGIAGVAIAEGNIINFQTAFGYGAMSAMVICAIGIAGPAFLKFTEARAGVGVATGLVLGFMGFSRGNSYINYTLENAEWVPYNFVMYISLCIPFAIGVGLIHIGTCDKYRLLKIATAALVVALVSSIFPYIGFAEEVFGLVDEKANYIYVPMLTGLVWSAVEFVESSLE